MELSVGSVPLCKILTELQDRNSELLHPLVGSIICHIVPMLVSGSNDAFGNHVLGGMAFHLCDGDALDGFGGSLAMVQLPEITISL